MLRKGTFSGSIGCPLYTDLSKFTYVEMKFVCLFV